jgi:hypothetical protein
MAFKFRGDGKLYPTSLPHDPVKDWPEGFFYCHYKPAPGKTEGLPAFQDGASEERDSWASDENRTIPSDLRLLILRIAKLVERELSGQDITLAWFLRWIQPLQHRAHLMHQYTGKMDMLRVTTDELTEDSIDRRMRKLTKVPWDHPEFCPVVEMYTNSSCRKLLSPTYVFLFHSRLNFYT